MSRVIPKMDEIIDKSLEELKETANALRITDAPSITKTQLKKLLLNDVTDDQFEREREREAFANKKELIKFAVETFEQKAKPDADALGKNRGLMLSHWKIILD